MAFNRVDKIKLQSIMKTIEKKQNLDVIPKKQLENIQGGLILTTSKKINYCPVCCFPLSDEDIIESGTDSYKYLCPNCGSKGLLKK